MQTLHTWRHVTFRRVALLAVLVVAATAWVARWCYPPFFHIAGITILRALRTVWVLGMCASLRRQPRQSRGDQVALFMFCFVAHSVTNAVFGTTFAPSVASHLIALACCRVWESALYVCATLPACVLALHLMKEKIGLSRSTLLALGVAVLAGGAILEVWPVPAHVMADGPLAVLVAVVRSLSWVVAVHASPSTLTHLVGGT